MKASLFRCRLSWLGHTCDVPTWPRQARDPTAADRVDWHEAALTLHRGDRGGAPCHVQAAGSVADDRVHPMARTVLSRERASPRGGIAAACGFELHVERRHRAGVRG